MTKLEDRASRMFSRAVSNAVSSRKPVDQLVHKEITMELERLEDLLTKALEVIDMHHKWQCEAKDVFIHYEEDGKLQEVEVSGEYGESDMCEKTHAVAAMLRREVMK